MQIIACDGAPGNHRSGPQPHSSQHWVRPLMLPTSRPLHYLATGRMACSVPRCHLIMYLLLRRGVICPVLEPANMPATRFWIGAQRARLMTAG